MENIQDQLERVAKKAEGTSEEPKDETLEEETTKPEETDESTDEEVDSKPKEDEEETDETKEDERKQASAFAAMRKRLKELEEENKALKTQQNPKEEPAGEEKPKETEDSETSELEERLTKAEKYIRQMELEKQQQRVTQEIIDVKQRYNLSSDELSEFADELEKRGFQIGNTSMSLTDMYAAINHEKIVQAEVEKAKQLIAHQSGDTPPSTGPKPNTGGATKQKDDVRSTIARVAAKLS